MYNIELINTVTVILTMKELNQCVKDVTDFAIRFKMANPHSDGKLTWKMTKCNYQGKIHLCHITLDKQRICQLLFFMIMNKDLRIKSNQLSN